MCDDTPNSKHEIFLRTRTSGGKLYLDVHYQCSLLSKECINRRRDDTSDYTENETSSINGLETSWSPCEERSAPRSVKDLDEDVPWEDISPEKKRVPDKSTGSIHGGGNYYSPHRTASPGGHELDMPWGHMKWHTHTREGAHSRGGKRRGARGAPLGNEAIMQQGIQDDTGLGFVCTGLHSVV